MVFCVIFHLLGTTWFQWLYNHDQHKWQTTGKITINQTSYNCPTPQQDDSRQYYTNDYRIQFTGLPLFKTKSLHHLHHVMTFRSVNHNYRYRKFTLTACSKIMVALLHFFRNNYFRNTVGQEQEFWMKQENSTSRDKTSNQTMLAYAIFWDQYKWRLTEKQCIQNDIYRFHCICRLYIYIFKKNLLDSMHILSFKAYDGCMIIRHASVDFLDYGTVFYSVLRFLLVK